MTKIYTVRTLIFATILTSTFFITGHGALAQQFEAKNQKALFWTIAKSDLVVKARKRLQAGKLEQAQRLYRKSLHTTLRRSDRFAALNDLCVLHNIEKQYEKARGYCSKALKLAPDNWRGFNNRGLAYFGLGNYELARQDFARALSLNPALKSGDSQLVLNKHPTQSKTSTEYAGK